jgi:hypothetical protein
VAPVSRVTLTTATATALLALQVRNQITLEGIREATVIFAGSAAEAVPAFPANVNVAAALSLAGIGPDRTQVRVIADPTCDKNVHEIEMEGAFGRMVVRMENVPSPETPKTSRRLSCYRPLRRLNALHWHRHSQARLTVDGLPQQGGAGSQDGCGRPATGASLSPGNAIGGRAIHDYPKEVLMSEPPVLLSALDTPSVVVYLDVLEANIAEMSRLAAEAGVKLRPHTKIHECPDIAKLQIAGGACGVEVGTV